MRIPVAHDFSCAWCWIGLHQVLDLQSEFGVDFDWLGYELYPVGTQIPPPLPQRVSTNRPETPSRLALAMAAQGMDRPTNRGPLQVRTHLAHRAVEFAKESGSQGGLVERFYHAYWEEGEDLSDHETLLRLASGYVSPELLRTILGGTTYADRITAFDEAAYSTGVYNVPTFWIGGIRYAEQPLRVLKEAVRRQLDVRT